MAMLQSRDVSTDAASERCTEMLGPPKKKLRFTKSLSSDDINAINAIYKSLVSSAAIYDNPLPSNNLSSSSEHRSLINSDIPAEVVEDVFSLEESILRASSESSSNTPPPFFQLLSETDIIEATPKNLPFDPIEGTGLKKMLSELVNMEDERALDSLFNAPIWILHSDFRVDMLASKNFKLTAQSLIVSLINKHNLSSELRSTITNVLRPKTTTSCIEGVPIDNKWTRALQPVAVGWADGTFELAARFDSESFADRPIAKYRDQIMNFAKEMTDEFQPLIKWYRNKGLMNLGSRKMLDSIMKILSLYKKLPEIESVKLAYKSYLTSLLTGNDCLGMGPGLRTSLRTSDDSSVYLSPSSKLGICYRLRMYEADVNSKLKQFMNLLKAHNDDSAQNLIQVIGMENKRLYAETVFQTFLLCDIKGLSASQEFWPMFQKLMTKNVDRNFLKAFCEKRAGL